ncbi:MAG: putative manganese transporter, partial [Lachnospiraceae bacterium]
MFFMIEDAFIDAVKILPFLFLTYLVIEYIEHKNDDKVKNFLKRSSKFGPIVGSLLGVIPQCGFSAAASNFYAGKIITLGTLIAVFLSTSDEMLPILISTGAPMKH